MGLREYFGFSSPDDGGVSLATAPEMSFNDLVENYDIVSTGEDYMVVEPIKKFSTADRADMREIGVSGSSQWGSYSGREYNQDLNGQQGLLKFDEMRRSDGTVTAALLARKMPILAARWYIEPASPSKRDKKIAGDIWKNLANQMSVSWPRFLSESLLHLDYGAYYFEKVFVKVDGKIRWRKFAPRHPLDCTEIEYDSHGGPTGVWFNSSVGTHSLAPANLQRRPGESFIPIEKLLAFTHAQEAGDLSGISLLRPMYKHWFIANTLYKIDAIQKERHGIGIPIIKLPPQANTSDKQLADQMGRNLRTNEKAHVVLPALWEIGNLKLEGQLVDPIASASHHNNMIMGSVLGHFLTDQNSGNSAETLVDMFLKASRNDAEVVRDTINKWAIPELVRYNYGKNVDPPTLEVRRIGEAADLRTLSFSLRNLVGAQLLRPDEPLLDSVRKEYDLPSVDPGTIIAPPAPQNPFGNGPKAPEAGPPRQSQAANMKTGPPSSKAGVDKSGSSGTKN